MFCALFETLLFSLILSEKKNSGQRIISNYGVVISSNEICRLLTLSYFLTYEFINDDQNVKSQEKVYEKNGRQRAANKP